MRPAVDVFRADLYFIYRIMYNNHTLNAAKDLAFIDCSISQGGNQKRKCREGLK